MNPDTRLAITLRILAGGAVIDIMAICGIGSATAYNVLHDTVAVLDHVLKFPRLPKEDRDLEKGARGFKTSRWNNSALDGFVGALDDICIEIRKQHEDSIPASFFCRKGYCAIPIQAVSDSNYMFLYASGLCRGATHDARANSVSGFMEEVQARLRGELF